MKYLFAASLLALSLCGCAQTGSILPGETFTTRELTPEEKHSLSQIISQSLKDPESARFKWMPVVLREREGITEYCGLVNGKNGYGGYTGFKRFYGHLAKDIGDRFTRIDVRLIENDSDHSPNILYVPRWMNSLCENLGYVDFSLAN